MAEKINTAALPDLQDRVVPNQTSLSSYIRPQARKPHDSSVKFEEYYYYSQRTREEEQQIASPKTNWKQILLRKKTENGTEIDDINLTASHLFVKGSTASGSDRLKISDEEWKNASRAFRTASWGACK